MLRKKAIQFKLVDAPADNQFPAGSSDNTTETKVIEVLKEGAKYGALMFVGYKVVDTMSKIAVIAAESKLK
jgi:hypothetical protein